MSIDAFNWAGLDVNLVLCMVPVIVGLCLFVADGVYRYSRLSAKDDTLGRMATLRMWWPLVLGAWFLALGCGGAARFLVWQLDDSTNMVWTAALALGLVTFGISTLWFPVYILEWSYERKASDGSKNNKKGYVDVIESRNPEPWVPAEGDTRGIWGLVFSCLVFSLGVSVTVVSWLESAVAGGLWLVFTVWAAVVMALAITFAAHRAGGCCADKAAAKRRGGDNYNRNRSTRSGY